MSTLVSPSSDVVPGRKGGRSRLGLRAVAWAAILGLALYFVAVNAVRYYSLDEATFGRYSDRAGWLIVHITAGMVALFIGPLQFWSAMRRRYTRLHRWSGRVYLVSIVVGSVAALYMIALTEAGWVFGLGLLGLAVAWLGTSGLALVAIRRGNIAQHREWMVRSYVVTFGFVTFRLFFDVLSAFGIGSHGERAAAASWFCWAVPLLITELVLQGRKVLAAPKRPLPALPE